MSDRSYKGAGRLWFFCPGCGDSHACQVEGPSPIWTWNGRTDRPTLSPSVLLEAAVTTEGKELSPRCHSFVRDGQIQYLTDCTHALAGQTVDIPDWQT